MQRYRTGFDNVHAGADCKRRAITEMLRMQASGEAAAAASNALSEATETRRAYRRNLRWLLPVAAALIACIVLLSIPHVAQAITDWVNDLFRTGRYMRAERGEDEAEPDMEKAILRIPTEEQSYEILLLNEIPATEGFSYEGIDSFRVESGQPAFKESDWAWIRDIVPRVDRVLYDGRNLVITTFYETDPLRFTPGYLSPIVEGEPACDILCLDYSLRVNGEPIPQGGWGHGLDFSKWYAKRNEPGFSLTDVREDGGVYAQIEINSPGGTPVLPDGICEAELVMTVQDAHTDDMGVVGMVAEIIHRFRFDTTAGNGLLHSETLEPVAFSGINTVTVRHYGELLTVASDNDDVRAYDVRGNRYDPDSVAWACNKRVRLGGLTVTPVVYRRSTGIHVELNYGLPARWDYDTQNAVVGALTYELIVDGVSQGVAYSADGEFLSPSIEISITESEQKSVDSIVLRPQISRIATWDKDMPMPLGRRIMLNRQQDSVTEPTLVSTPLSGCDIVIPIQ